LCFAHRGEAQAFLKFYAYTPALEKFPGLFSSGKNYLLLTGEGLINASVKTASVLGLLQTKIKNVINIGLAGSLSKSIQLQEVYRIRTIYGHGELNPYFHSFTSVSHLGIDGLPVADILSHSDRVLNSESAIRLAPFADLVDREAWGVARACQNFKLAFFCLKLASDAPINQLIQDEQTDQTLCARIKLEAQHLSQKLLLAYQKFDEQKAGTCELDLEDAPSLAKIYLDSPHFYFTHSMQNRFEKLVHSFELRWGQQEAERRLAAMAELLSQNKFMGAKMRALNFLAHVKKGLNTLQNEIDLAIQNVMQPYQSAGIYAKHLPNGFDSKLQIYFNISSRHELEMIMKLLAQLPVEKLHELYHGEPNQLPPLIRSLESHV